MCIFWVECVMPHVIFIPVNKHCLFIFGVWSSGCSLRLYFKPICVAFLILLFISQQASSESLLGMHRVQGYAFHTHLRLVWGCISRGGTVEAVQRRAIIVFVTGYRIMIFRWAAEKRKTNPNSNLEFHCVRKMLSPLRKLKIMSMSIKLFEILSRLYNGWYYLGFSELKLLLTPGTCIFPKVLGRMSVMIWESGKFLPVPSLEDPFSFVV